MAARGTEAREVLTQSGEKQNGRGTRGQSARGGERNDDGSAHSLHILGPRLSIREAELTTTPYHMQTMTSPLYSHWLPTTTL